MPETSKPKGWKARFAHAFAVEKPGAIDPTPQQREIVDRLCAEVVRRGMVTPALLALEMSRPLNVLGATALHMLQPMIAAVMHPAASEQFALFLEHRGSIDYLCGRIEHFQSARWEARSDDGAANHAAAGDAHTVDGEDASSDHAT